MKKRLLLIFCSIISVYSFGQKDSTQSRGAYLLENLKKAGSVNTDSAVVYYHKHLNEILTLKGTINYPAEWHFAYGKIYGDKFKFDSAFYYYDKASLLFNKSVDYARIRWLNYSKAIALFYTDQREEGIQILNHIIDLNMNNPDTSNLGRAYSLLGVMYHSVGKPGKSIRMNKEAIKYFALVKKLDLLSGTFTNIANRYYDLGMYDLALQNLLKADSICQKITCPKRINGITNINLGRVYKSLGKVDSSDFYYNRVAADSSMHISALVTLYRNWSRDKMDVDQKLSIEYAEKYAGLYKFEGDNNQMNLNLVLGRAYGHFKFSQKGINHLLKSREIAIKLNDTEYIALIDKELSFQYTLDKNYQKALEHLESSIVNGKKLRKNALHSLNVLSNEVYNFQKQKIKKVQETNVLKIKKAKRFLNLIIYSCIALMLIIFGIIYSKLKAASLSKNITRQEEALKKIKIEKINVEKAKIKKEIILKEAEIEDAKSQIIDKNSLIDTLIENSKINASHTGASVLNSLKSQIEDLKNTKSNWKEFSTRFDDLHNDFIKRLSEQFPELNEKEKRLCALLKMNLNSKEIASLLNINHASVNTARYRLRKKLKIQEKSIIKFFQEFNEKANV